MLANCKFWQDVCNWTRSVLKIHSESQYTECEIIFGYNIFESKYSTSTHIQNIIIFVRKWYLNRNRVENSNVSFSQFLVILKHKLEIYTFSYAEKYPLRETDRELESKLKKIIKLF